MCIDNGKVRAEAHIIDQEAILIIRRKLPREWVIRELTPDYGLDLDVELFEKENGKIVTLGERLYLQVKGTTKANYKDVEINADGKRMVKKCIVFPIDTALLKLVERVGDSLPILLVIVDVNTENAFCVSLNDYVDYVLCDESWRNQDTKTIYIPCANTLESIELLRWYAMRPKLKSFFAEASALMIDVEYEAEPEGYIKLVKRFAMKYRESDIWNCEKIGFVLLDTVHEMVDDIINDRESEKCATFFKGFADDDYVSNGRFEDMALNVAKQYYMSQRLIEEIGNANCIFSSCSRQLFTITKYEAEVSV